MKPEDKKCGESCGCGDKQELQLDDQNLAKEPEEKSTQIKLDPTHFGDWQINGRAIDF